MRIVCPQAVFATQPPRKLVDLQAQALLNQMTAMAAQAPTPASPLSPEEELAAARQGYRAAIPLADSPEAVLKVEERYITGLKGDIAVRIYTPQDNGNLPILVYFHGGGFTSGDLCVPAVRSRPVFVASGTCLHRRVRPPAR